MLRKTAIWNKPTIDLWYNLGNIPFIWGAGVYLIFNEEEVLYVGQSEINIQERLFYHGTNTLTDELDPLFFTWAICALLDLDGVERFLIDRYNPPYNQNRPLVQPIAVNLPALPF